MAAEAERHSALKAVVLQHRRRLLHVAERILHDESEAEDVVQDTLAAVFRRLGSREVPRLRNYVYRAVRINALKRKAGRDWLPLAEIDGFPAPQAAPSEPDEPDIDPAALERAILNLPPAQQAVIRMRYYLDMSFRQIGQALAVSLWTAASRCRYALAKMREVLSKGTQREKEKP